MSAGARRSSAMANSRALIALSIAMVWTSLSGSLVELPMELTPHRLHVRPAV